MQKFSLIKLKPVVYSKYRALIFAFVFLKNGAGIDESIAALETLKSLKEYADSNGFQLNINSPGQVQGLRELHSDEMKLVNIYNFHNKIIYYNETIEKCSWELESCKAEKEKLKPCVEIKREPIVDIPSSIQLLKTRLAEIQKELDILPNPFSPSSIFKYCKNSSKLENERTDILQKVEELLKKYKTKLPGPSREELVNKQKLQRLELRIIQINQDIQTIKNDLNNVFFTTDDSYDYHSERARYLQGSGNCELEYLIANQPKFIKVCQEFIKKHKLQVSNEIATLLELA